MKGVFFLKNLDELNNLQSKQIELIISPKELSRFGQLSIEDSIQALDFCQGQGIPAFLEWDILMTENDFQQSLKVLAKLPLDKFSAIRVQDIGAYHYLLNQTNFKIQLILESGNHNFEAIKKWESVGGNQLDRIILGLELPKNILKKYISQLTTPCELQVLGKILLFYSPRSLLSKPLELQQEFIETTGSSEETPHKGFKIIENRHGTFMFLPKDQYLLDVYSELLETNLAAIRFDHRFLEGNLKINDVINLYLINSEEKRLFFKENYGAKFIRGYFNVNRSDAIFTKLKNSRMVKKSDHYVGKVVDVKKDEYLAISLFNNTNRKLKIGDLIEVSSPDGRAKKVEVKSIKTVGLKNIDQINNEKIVLIPHVGGTSVKAHVHFLD